MSRTRKVIRYALGLMLGLSIAILCTSNSNKVLAAENKSVTPSEFSGVIRGTTSTTVNTFRANSTGVHTVSIYTRYQSGSRCDYFTYVITDAKDNYITSTNTSSDTGGKTLKVNLVADKSYKVVLWQVGESAGTYAYSGLIY